MINKKLLMILLASFSLTACSTTDLITKPIKALPSSDVCCSSYSQYPWIQLDTKEDFDFQLDANAPIGNFSDGNSFFNAFKFAEKSKKVRLRIESYMLNGTVVAPKIITFDDNFNIVNTINFTQFKLQQAGAFSRNQFRLNVEIEASKTPYFIIYSSEEYLGQSIKVKHPARVRAEETGEPMPTVTDPVYLYSRFGELNLTVKTLSLQPRKRVKKEAQVVISQAEPETQTFYKNAIIKAVNADDMPKALKLLEEAKALGINDADETFIDALKKTKS